MTTTANTVPAIEREAMEYDVVIVGGGPAGLAAAIRIKQRAAESGQDVSVVVLEKGSELGAHILSGAVMDPRAIDELIPDWKERGAPLDTPVTEDRFYLLTEHKAYANPHWLLPDCFINDGYYVVSLANVVRWLGTQAEELGVEVFAGFAAAEVLYDGNGAVRGVATGNMGVGKDGQPTANFQPGVELLGKYTLFAEGARGHLGKQVIAQHRPRRGPRSADLGDRNQGGLGDRPGEARPGTGRAQRRLAARPRDLRRRFPVPHGRATRCRWAWSSAWATPIPTSSRSRNSSATRRTRCSPASSKAASASPTARGRSTPAACSRCPSSSSPAGRSSAATRAS